MKKPLLSAICLVALLLFPSAAISGAREGVELCVNVIIPSLLPFMVLIRYIPAQGSVWFAFIMGLVAGYPSGAKILGKNADASLVGACNNCGVMFVVGMVGAGVFGCTHTGWLIFVAHVISAAIMLIFADRRVCVTIKSVPINPIVDTAKTMAIVCTSIVFFSSLINVFQLPPFVAGLVEMSRGVTALPKSALSVAFAAFFVTFGGACVHMQTFAIAERMDKVAYIARKTVQALIAAGLSFVLGRMIPACIPTAAVENSVVYMPNLWVYSLVLCALCVAVCLLLTKCFEMIK